MEFVQDKDQMNKFEAELQELMHFLKEAEESHHYKTVTTLISDNIKMFNRIKELEDGKANARKTE